MEIKRQTMPISELAEFEYARMLATVTSGAVSEIEDALCEADMAVDERIGEIENALCELDAE